MSITIANLKVGERGCIEQIAIKNIPLKLLEMGCLPGKEVQLIQVAPFNDPLYINVNGSYLAIRREVAKKIKISKL